MLPCQKHLFRLPADRPYLNCAYMSPLSVEVEAAGHRAMRREHNPAAMSPDDFFRESDALRAAFAHLIGANRARDVAIIPSVSYGIATAAANLELGTGRNVVVAHEQFPSNVYAWRTACRRAGARVRTVAPPPSSSRRGAAWNELLLDAIDSETAAVALPNVHWADGTRFDLEAIGRRAREVGAALIIDGTQSIGAMPFDVGRIRPDAVVCAGYKWLFGAYGLGLAYYGPRFAEGLPLEENWITRRDSEAFSRLVEYQDAYQPGAVRYDVGERSSFLLVPMLAQGLKHISTWTPEGIQAYCAALTRPLMEALPDLGYAVEAEDWRGAHLFGIRLPEGLPIEDVKAELGRRGISVSVRGTAIRVSPHVYNDRADVEALNEALRVLSRRPDFSLS